MQYKLKTNIKINLFVEFKSDIDLILIVKLIVINRDVLTGWIGGLTPQRLEKMMRVDKNLQLGSICV